MNEEDNNNGALEERVSPIDGFKEVGKMFTNDPNQIVESDDEVLEKMEKDLKKKIDRCTDSTQKAELNKELLILQILILQREKIDKEADVILSTDDAIGIDIENDKKKKKKKKERDKMQQALIDKLNELGISNLNIDIKTPKEPTGRERGGMERQQRTR